MTSSHLHFSLDCFRCSLVDCGAGSESGFCSLTDSYPARQVRNILHTCQPILAAFQVTSSQEGEQWGELWKYWVTEAETACRQSCQRTWCSWGTALPARWGPSGSPPGPGVGRFTRTRRNKCAAPNFTSSDQPLLGTRGVSLSVRLEISHQIRSTCRNVTLSCHYVTLCQFYCQPASLKILIVCFTRIMQ